MSEPHHEIEDHDRGLAFDLATIQQRIADRRSALRLFAGLGTAAVVTACGGESATSTTSSTAATTTTVTPTATATATATPTPTATATSTGAACIADPTETGGPFPADGTNTSSGSTSNVLTSSGVVRSDIRASFIGSATVATGTAVTLTLTVVNSNAACAPLSGYAVYLWHCDRSGLYSLYDLPAESYLRGVQVTNAAGQVTFTTIFPACYSGRYPHMHFEVFTTQSTATSGRAAKLTSQLAMPAAICNAVFTQTTLYPNSASRFAQVSISNDNVFGDNSAAQIAQQTPAFSGSVAAGYTATATIGVAV